MDTKTNGLASGPVPLPDIIGQTEVLTISVTHDVEGISKLEVRTADGSQTFHPRTALAISISLAQSYIFATDNPLGALIRVMEGLKAVVLDRIDVLTVRQAREGLPVDAPPVGN